MTASRKLLAFVLLASSLATAQSAHAYDQLPSHFFFDKTAPNMVVSPSNMPTGRPVDSGYYVNTSGSLGDISALSQYVSFQASWLGSGPNILTQDVGDHIVVGLNHQYFPSIPGNRFVGVVIGLACQNQPSGSQAAIQIEWKAQDIGLGDAFSSCFFPPPGTTSLRFDFTASYAGYATLHISDGSGNYLGSIDDHQPAYVGYAQTPMGAAIVGLGGSSSSYQMSIDVLSHGFLICH